MVFYTTFIEVEIFGIRRNIGFQKQGQRLAKNHQHIFAKVSQKNQQPPSKTDAYIPLLSEMQNSWRFCFTIFRLNNSAKVTGLRNIADWNKHFDTSLYIVFRRFRQSKYVDGSLILSNLCYCPSCLEKKKFASRVVEIGLKIII